MSARTAAPRWTAEEVKAALRRRHPATQPMGVRTVPGPWTCVEELLGCDLIAFAAVSSPPRAHVPGVRYPRIGYEVKVSRSDYRVELRNPEKRVRAVGYTNEFYIAVPAGLLRPEEKAWTPDPPRDEDGRLFEPTGPQPSLWVPADVGLVEVTRSGCRVAKPSPIRKEPTAIDARALGTLARHISSHPDPRHDGVVAADRELSRQLREADRQRREQRKRWAA